MAQFEVQARVIDLFGLQQIANCPTAISELFKNAWDAYAENVMLDVYPESDQVILWDDGVGMNHDELLQRWLVIGVAGREDLKVSVEPPEGLAPRPIQGEKGIGRLAVSTIGDTVLLISRSRHTQDEDKPFVALLMNWNIVLNEHLRLSDLDVPCLAFADIDELDKGVINEMVTALRADLESERQSYAWEDVYDLEKRRNALTLRQRIFDQLDSFQLEMVSFRRTVRSWKGHGVIFCIRHLHEDFRRHLDKPRRDEDNEAFVDLVQLLSNFRNRFDGENNSTEVDDIRFTVDIRLWEDRNRGFLSLFAETAAFEPQDLRFYDHLLDVSFDEDGRFHGDLEIYGERVTLPNMTAQRAQKLHCGPFRLPILVFPGQEGVSA